MLSAFVAGIAAAAAAAGPAPAQASAWETIGQSGQGRPIRALRVGSARARVKVLVVGLIHGNEQAGRAVVARLRHARPPRGTALWLVDSANPDGEAAGGRWNAHGVDLNRNFPYRWQPQDGVYESGPGPASEAETQVMQRFIERERPRVTHLVPPGAPHGREEHGRPEARAPLLRAQRPAAQGPAALPRHGGLLAEPHLPRRQRLRRRAARRSAAGGGRPPPRERGAVAGARASRRRARWRSRSRTAPSARADMARLRAAPLRHPRLAPARPEGDRRALHRHVHVRARLQPVLPQRAGPGAARAARRLLALRDRPRRHDLPAGEADRSCAATPSA